MTRIRIFYTDSTSETIDVYDYTFKDGWFMYDCNVHTRKPVAIPSHAIKRVERL